MLEVEVYNNGPWLVGIDAAQFGKGVIGVLLTQKQVTTLRDFLTDALEGA